MPPETADWVGGGALGVLGGIVWMFLAHLKRERESSQEFLKLLKSDFEQNLERAHETHKSAVAHLATSVDRLAEAIKESKTV